MGLIYQEMEKPAEAWHQVQIAQFIGIDSPGSMLISSQIARDQGRKDEALEFLWRGFELLSKPNLSKNFYSFTYRLWGLETDLSPYLVKTGVVEKTIEYLNYLHQSLIEIGELEKEREVRNLAAEEPRILVEVDHPMQSEKRQSSSTTITLALLGVATFILRWIFRSQTLFNWDSVNFALGLSDFDLTQHRPHPPGYYFYIQLGRLLQTWTKDANAALVWMSILAGTALVLVVFLYANRRFGFAFGLISALLTVTNPLIWFYDELRAYLFSRSIFFSRDRLRVFSTAKRVTTLGSCERADCLE